MSSRGEDVERLFALSQEAGDVIVPMPVSLVSGLIRDLNSAARTIDHLRTVRSETHVLFLTNAELKGLRHYLSHDVRPPFVQLSTRVFATERPGGIDLTKE